jgi:phospholipase/lecithinase/hemolysin
MLHGLGARKMVVTGVGPLGCYPLKRKLIKDGECDAEVDFWSARYNDGLKMMLRDLKSESKGMKYVYFDMYGAMSNLFQNPKTYGILYSSVHLPPFSYKLTIGIYIYAKYDGLRL